MSLRVKKAAVIGAGSMGSAIAAQFANGGIPVVLLDVVPAGAADRNVLARSAVQRQIKTGGFMHPDCSELVTVGNIEDDLHLVGDADWIVEAVIEELNVKRDLFTKLEKLRRNGSAVTSNTSTIRLSELTKGLGARFESDFLITHFCNPPRHLRLLEVIAGRNTSPATLDLVRNGADVGLGKTVLNCRDTPGFVANRIGCYWMAAATLEAINNGLTIEEADAVMGSPFGIPGTGIFKLWDLCGIDLIPLVWGSLYAALPINDPMQLYDLPSAPLIRSMIDKGLLGRKAGGGFYRQGVAEGRKTKEALELKSQVYRPIQPATLNPSLLDPRNLRALCESGGRAGNYAWTVLSNLVSYAATVKSEIVDDISGIDLAMRLGYGWQGGPFQIADRVGAAWIAERMVAEGRTIPPLLARAAERGGFYASARGDNRPLSSDASAPTDGKIFLPTVSDRGALLLENSSAVLWNIGEGIACLELRTKMNIFDLDVFDLIIRTVENFPKGFRGLVIGNDHPRAFSTGADLSFFLDRVKHGDWQALATFLQRGQTAFQALKYAPFPVVGAAHGLALGGGCEVLLHCDRIVAHAELYAGLPEVKVGLLPGWGGCTQMLLRSVAESAIDAQSVKSVFDLILKAKVSSSALEARSGSILRPQDIIVMNRDRLLHEARRIAVCLAEAGYRAPAPRVLETGPETLRAGLLGSVSADEVDMEIAEALATILSGNTSITGSPISESLLLELERETVLSLSRRPVTVQRIERVIARKP